MDMAKDQPDPTGPRAGTADTRPEAPEKPRHANAVVDDAIALQARIQAEQALLESGTPGRATITNCINTGVLVNFNPQVVLDLSVALSGQPPYELQLTTSVPTIYLSRLLTGSDVSVRVDPSTPQRVVIDWSAG